MLLALKAAAFGYWGSPWTKTVLLFAILGYVSGYTSLLDAKALLRGASEGGFSYYLMKNRASNQHSSLNDAGIPFEGNVTAK